MFERPRLPFAEKSPNEPGELVHRGALVGQGYWNDAAKTAERYKLLPSGTSGREAGLQSGPGVRSPISHVPSPKPA